MEVAEGKLENKGEKKKITAAFGGAAFRVIYNHPEYRKEVTIRKSVC